MQTPKSRNSTSDAPRKLSPRTAAVDVPQRISSPSVSSELPQKPRAARHLKTSSSESNSPSKQTSIKNKDRSPKVIERRSPRSPLSEKKRPSRISELESQISQLQEDLDKARDQLNSTEASKKLAQQHAEDSKQQLLVMSKKLEESQKQLLELSPSSSKEENLVELEKESQEQDRECHSVIKASEKQHLVGSAALSLAMDEINQLKVKLEAVVQSETTQTKYVELAHTGLQKLKENLSEILVLVGYMKNQPTNFVEPETREQALVGETLLQLETAKKTVEALTLDNSKSMEAYSSIASQVDQSRAVVKLLEQIVTRLEPRKDNGSSNDTENFAGCQDLTSDIGESEHADKSIQTEPFSTKSEVELLKSGLDTAETRNHEEQVQNAMQISEACELMEQMKSAASQRETELEEELKRSKYNIEELKANLMDKETELQGICEENESLQTKLQRSLTGQRENESEKDLKKLKQVVENLKANLMDKETELQNILEENSMLKTDTKKRDTKRGKVNDEAVVELNAARAAEQDALTKLGYVTEEADKSNTRAVRVGEELEAVRVANSELERELRKLKVQSDQWRKAAEAAAAMLSTGNNVKLIERTGSLDSNDGKVNSPYPEDTDDDLLKKRNGKMLKRISDVLWKRSQKSNAS